MDVSSVYGPVDSWRLGRSLGVDLLAVDSICSFNCIYCQLGKIYQTTLERGVFVTTERVMDDLSVSFWENSDVVTFSGSGEPTLAKNLGEVVELVKLFTAKPVVVLTNSSTLAADDVRRELCLADRVFCKLDAWNAEMLRRINRPMPGVTLDGIVDGLSRLRGEFQGDFAIQTMLLKDMDDGDVDEFARIINRIGPDEIQLNVPSRPVPASFSIGNRGNVTEAPSGAHVLKTLSRGQILAIRDRMEPLVGCKVLCREAISGSP